MHVQRRFNRFGTFCCLIALTMFGAAGTARAADHEEFKRHVPGVFIGATSGNGETAYTLGLEYEFRATQLIGVGAVAEYSPDLHHDDGVGVFLGTVNLHPAGALRLTAGYGKEDVFHGGKSHSLIRVGASYDFHVGDFGIAPTLNIDFVDHKEIAVFGISLVRPF